MKCRICKNEIKHRRGAGVFYRIYHNYANHITDLDYVMPMHASCATEPFDRRRYVDIDKADYILNDYKKVLMQIQGLMFVFLLIAVFLIDQKYTTISIMIVIITDLIISIPDIVNIFILTKMKNLPL